MDEFGLIKGISTCSSCNKTGENMYISNKSGNVYCWDCVWAEADANALSIEEKRDNLSGRIQKICECGNIFDVSRFQPYINKCKSCRSKK